MLMSQLTRRTEAEHSSLSLSRCCNTVCIVLSVRSHSNQFLLICIDAARRSGRQDNVDRNCWYCHLTIQNLVHEGQSLNLKCVRLSSRNSSCNCWSKEVTLVCMMKLKVSIWPLSTLIFSKLLSQPWYMDPILQRHIPCQNGLMRCKPTFYNQLVNL